MATDDENKLQALIEMRSRAEEFLSNDLVKDDTFLMRWLIAREFDVDKAVKMLKNYIEWREENEIDRILEWEPPEDIRKACPYEISCHDRQGRPVLIFPWAQWTPWDFTSTGRREEYLKYMYQMLEKCVAAIRKPATQFVVLADSEGFSFRHMSQVKALETNLEALKGFECRYPEMISLAYAVNCPKVFSLLYTIISPLMSPRTKEKLHVYDSNSAKWKNHLTNYISDEELPEKYGGRRKSQAHTFSNHSEMISNPVLSQKTMS